MENCFCQLFIVACEIKHNVTVMLIDVQVAVYINNEVKSSRTSMLSENAFVVVEVGEL